ncbi:MAG: ATP-binding cassette domain-containing protein [Pseudomonadota bacterium]|nr:ATP-binding cassette domain-containing protein [Pseudomonadota bacterium]
MSEPQLAARFQEVLLARDVTLAPDMVRRSADLVRLLLRVAAPSGEEVAGVVPAVCAAVSRRTGLHPDEAAELVALAAAPEFRGVVDVHEVDAFVGRFGALAGRRLQDEDAASLDLRGFAATYGPEEALRFVDALLIVLAPDGVLPPGASRRVEAAAEELGVDPVLLSALLRRRDSGAEDRTWPLRGERLRIGRSPGADIVLLDPQVALRHADLVASAGRWRVVDGESGRPTVLNGRPVSSAPLTGDEELRIGPYVLRIDLVAGTVTARNERAFTALSARRLTRQIGEVSLLDDASFTVFAGEVIAMVGPSGAGKTTLLNAIAGVTAADSGAVLLDGADFHALLAVDRSRIGVVPQDDIVLPELTVEESLFYSGRLRFSRAVDDATLRLEVDRVLGELGIPHIRGSRIGDAVRRGISGGQRKRVNLGQELLTRSTRVLFLDEPTSGLDPRAAQDIVRLVRQLADRGRIVFLVTHDLSPQVMAQVDHLLVLAPGGRVAWFGPPDEACVYFAVPTPDAIFNRFQEKTPAEWGEAYRQSREFRTWVRTREALLELGLRPDAPDEAQAEPPTPPSMGAQLRTLVERYGRTKLRDRTGLWVLAAQPPFLALVMAVVFPKPTSSMLFMLSLSCLWFGMSVSVRELISDRVVWRRERRVGVQVGAYVGSKLLVLGFVSVVQCCFLAALAWGMFGLGEYGFNPLALMGVASLTGLTGMTLGLFVSGLFSSSEAAVGTLPLLLIPQITFSSLLVGLRDMSPAARALTWLDPQRYAFDATLKVGAKLAKASRVPGEWAVQSMIGPLYELGLKGADADDLGLSLPVLCAALIGFSTLFAVGAFGAVARRKE